MLPFPQIDPVAFSFGAGPINLQITWYALAYMFGLIGGWFIADRALARPALWGGSPPMSRAAFTDFVLWITAGVVVGGRLGHVLFYDPALLATPLEIFAIWEGGMSFHGGLAGVCVAAILFARSLGAPLRQCADLLALAAPVGLLLGRLANFINAELWGRPTDAPWGVIFPGNAALCADGAPCARHPSQLYEAGLEGLLLGALLITLAFGTRALSRPGTIAGLFFLGYGAARFFVEFFRQADAQFITPDNPLGHVLALGPIGLSMGQLLSMPMILAGLALILAGRASAQPATNTNGATT